MQGTFADPEVSVLDPHDPWVSLSTQNGRENGSEDDGGAMD